MPRPVAEAHATDAPPIAAAPVLPRSRSLAQAATALSLAQVVVFLAGIVTGPLLARSLGVTGRGELASIVVPITLLGWIAGLGLGSWVTVEAARGRDLGSVLGTTGVLSIALGIIGALAAIPAAIALADHRSTVLLFMVIGAALVPFSLCVQLLSCAAIGCSRWRMQARHRSVPPIASIALTAGLFSAGLLTLTTATMVFLIVGVISIVPLLPLLREAWPLHFDRALAKQALGFGVRAWTSALGALTNARVDQLLMIPLVPARQLGLYAVAVTYAALPTIISAALTTVIIPRISTGDYALVGRGLRVTIGLVTFVGLALALVAPIVIPLAFGSEFEPSVEMAWILLLAGVPFAGTLILTSALTSAGRPGTPAIGQFLAAIVTVCGLLLFLSTAQAIGAAVVSLVAYSLSLIFLLTATKRHLGTTLGVLLKPRRSDLYWALSILRSMRARFPGTPSLPAG